MTDDGGSTSPGHPANRAGWYALGLRPNHEFRVRGALRDCGIEAYVPTLTEQSRWSDRTRTIERPLFPGYLFVRTDERLLLLVMGIPGVLAVLPSRREPELIPEREIENLRTALSSGKPAVECPYAAGELVRIERGPLAGVEGRVERTRGACGVTVGIEILRRAVRVEIDAADLQRRDK